MATPSFNLDNIPPEIIKTMMGYLPGSDLKNLEFAQELFQDMAKDPNLWRKLAKSYNISLYEGEKNPVTALTEKIQLRVAYLGEIFPELAEGQNIFVAYDRIREYIKDNPKQAFERIQGYLETLYSTRPDYALFHIAFLVEIGDFKPTTEMILNIFKAKIGSAIVFAYFSTSLLSMSAEEQKTLLQNELISDYVNSNFLRYIVDTMSLKISDRLEINDANEEQSKGLREALSSYKGQKIAEEMMELFMLWHEKGVTGSEDYNSEKLVAYSLVCPALKPMFEILMKDHPNCLTLGVLADAYNFGAHEDQLKYLLQNIKMDEEEVKEVREFLLASPRPEVRELVNLLPH